MRLIKYFIAPDVEERAKEIAENSAIKRDFSRIHFMRSTGSKSRRTLARCHTVPRVIQSALSIKAHYVIEIISERFDRMDPEEQVKTIIHELLHIPKGMKGGFRQHDYVCGANVEQFYKSYVNSKK